MNGVVFPLYDYASNCVPSTALYDLLDSLSPTPLAVRCSLTAGPDNRINAPAYRTGIDELARRGHPVYLTIEQGISHLPNPNAPLGRGKDGQADALLNPWTDDASLQACTGLGAIGPDGIAGLLVGNEPQLAGTSLQPGQPIPTQWPSALSYQVYASWLYQTVERLHALVPWTRDIPIMPAPCSALVAFYHDQAGIEPFIGNYWRGIIATLTAAGRKPTRMIATAGPYWDWEGIAVNCEGVITKSFGINDGQHTYADFLYAYLTRLKTELDIAGATITGEYGLMNVGMQPTVMRQIHAKVTQYSPLRFFYQLLLIYPGNDTDYGLEDFDLTGGVFVPKRHAPLLPVMQQIWGESP